jgi:integrase/recombinase XerC
MLVSPVADKTTGDAKMKNTAKTTTAIASNIAVSQVQPGAAIEGVIVGPATLESGLSSFLSVMEGRNLSQRTIRAYGADISHFLSWLQFQYPMGIAPDEVLTSDIDDYLHQLASQKLMGVSRLRKLSAIKSYFTFLKQRGLISTSPASDVRSPKREQRDKVWLREDEYNKILVRAAHDPRDFALLQVLLQTGVRVSELCELEISDVDFYGNELLVRFGKGNKQRRIPVAKKAVDALKRWLKVRDELSPPPPTDHLFLNRYGQPFSDRGIRKLVAKYGKAAELTKRTTPHVFRRTFGTQKLIKGYPLPKLQKFYGHAKPSTTMGYVDMTMLNLKEENERTSL